ncbi:MAG: hypothetical protein IJX99_01980 [Clostridia bacterium]|nr:hypothetical protein [Clostridia bacterium]
MKSKFLYYFTKINTYVFITCLLYYIQKFIINIFLKIPENLLLEVIYFALALLFIKKHVIIDSPYLKD